MNRCANSVLGRLVGLGSSETGLFAVFVVSESASTTVGASFGAPDRLRRKNRIAAINVTAAAPPTAMPAIAPVPMLLLLEESVCSAYLRVKSCVSIILTEAVEAPSVAVGGTRGSGGVVTQGVLPASVDEYMDQPLDECEYR